MKYFFLLVLLLTSLCQTACSSLGVEPWQRGHLAKQKLQLEPYPVDAFLDEHIYFSKEASRGGSGLGGGGCGCN